MKIEEDEIMNSHDVVSLFTIMTLEDANAVIRKRLEQDTTLYKITLLQVDDAA